VNKKPFKYQRVWNSWRATDKTFVSIWQTSNSVEEVRDKLKDLLWKTTEEYCTVMPKLAASELYNIETRAQKLREECIPLKKMVRHELLEDRTLELQKLALSVLPV